MSSTTTDKEYGCTIFKAAESISAEKDVTCTKCDDGFALKTVYTDSFTTASYNRCTKMPTGDNIYDLSNHCKTYKVNGDGTVYCLTCEDNYTLKEKYDGTTSNTIGGTMVSVSCVQIASGNIGYGCVKL